MNILSKTINRIRNSRELKKSNYGRDFGWYIEYEGEIVGELVDPKFSDMFWYSYKVIPKKKEFEVIVFNVDLWMKSVFKYRSKKYDKYVNAIPGGYLNGWLKKTGRIDMRYLYILKL